MKPKTKCISLICQAAKCQAAKLTENLVPAILSGLWGAVAKW